VKKGKEEEKKKRNSEEKGTGYFIPLFKLIKKITSLRLQICSTAGEQKRKRRRRKRNNEENGKSYKLSLRLMKKKQPLGTTD
jgi:hypothetical protein